MYTAVVFMRKLQSFLFATSILLAAAPFAAAEAGISDAEGVEENIIGYSVEKRAITAVTLGEGDKNVILIGGIHGGYEWNTIVLARKVMEYYGANREEIPAGYTLHFIPNMNPDGLYKITGGEPIGTVNFAEKNTAPGRFNANGVDLNRNWDDEEWKPTSYWGHRVVDAGTHPFSEPETRIVRDYINHRNPELVIFFQSAANGIWYGGKQDMWEPARRFAEAYAEASGYPLPRGTDGPVSYEITGSASGYLYSRGIPALTIELETHLQIEYERNLAGVKAAFRLLPD